MCFKLVPLQVAKEVQLFPAGLGLYSGIFAIYLQSPPKESRTATIIFSVLCLLYILSTATVVTDVLNNIIAVSKRFYLVRTSFFINYADGYQYTSTSN